MQTQLRVGASQRPCGGPQPSGHTATAQFADSQPASHLHFPSTHLPCFEQPSGHCGAAIALVEQSSPLHPAWQKHTPSRQ